MKARVLFIVGLIAMVALIAVACAPAPTPVPPPPPPTTAPAAQATTASAAPTSAPTKAPTAVPPTATPAGPKKITIAFWQEPDSLIPGYTSMSFAIWADEICCTGLWNWDDKNNIEPELAAQIPSVANGGVSADGKTVTIKLRDGLKWQDGQPLTSADIAFTISVYQNQKNTGISSRYGFDKSAGGSYITSVDTPDAVTAVIHYSAAFGAWQAYLGLSSNGGMGLLPAHLLKDKPTLDKDPFQQKPVGAGPFMITDWVSGDHITMKANPNYWRGKPKLDEVDIKIVPSSEAGMAAVQTGDVDWVVDLAESNIPDVTAMAPKVNLNVIKTSNFEHLLFNLDPKLGPAFFQDVQVRKAIIMGIDRDTIVQKLLYGKTTAPADLWPNSPWENTSLKPYPYDTKQAMATLEADGWKKGSDGIYAKTINGQNTRLSFSYMTTSGNQLRADQQVLITQQLKKIGVEMTIQDVPASTFFGTFADNGPLATGNYQMAGYTTGFYPDPDPGDNFLCSGIPTKDNPSGGNFYHLCDAKLDALSKQQAVTADPVARKAILDQMQQMQYDNVDFIPMYARLDVAALNPRLTGVSGAGNGDLYWNAWNWDVTK